MSSPNCRHRRLGGFTLVELLVVIGIIAVLISILLPALSAARRQANTVRCAAHLRDWGNAFNMYSAENGGWWPVVQHDNYVVGNITTPGTGNFAAFWWDFLSKYMTKNKTGVWSTTNDEAGQNQRSILWGCPAWQGHYTGTLGGLNRNMPGYGMSWEVLTTPDYPAPMGSTGTNKAIRVSWLMGKFYRQSQWKRAAERALLADAKFYSIEQTPAPLSATRLPGQEYQLTVTYGSPAQQGESTFDGYRHSKPPPIIPGTTRLDPNYPGALNVLFCDGHVSTVDRIGAYESVRQRFPG